MPGEPVACRLEHSARHTGLRLAEANAGAIAFPRTSDPSEGEFELAKIIERLGDTLRRGD